MVSQRNIHTLVFVCIFLTAIVLRIYSLESIPSGFHRDEVANAYLGRFVIENGRDVYGNTWPLFAIDKKGDYPPVLPMYVSGLSTKIFGENVWATRFPYAIAGVITVILTYLIALKIFEKKSFAFLSMLASATMPWQVLFSRMSLEGVLAGLVFMLGMYMLVGFIKTERKIYLLSNTFFWMLTYLLYPSYRIVVPVIYVFLFIFIKIFKYSKKKNSSLYIFFIAAFACVLMVWISQTEWGSGRISQTSWLYAYMDGNPMEQYTMQDGNIFTARLFNNKYVYFFNSFIKEYLQYFSPQFLVLDSARPVWFATPRVGLLPLWIYFFAVVLLGFSSHIMQNKDMRMWYVFLLIVLLGSPLGSALTSEHTPNAHRAYQLSLVIPLMLPFAMEIFLIINKKNLKTILCIFLSVSILGETLWLSYNMVTQWNMFSVVYRDDGLLQTAEDIYKNKNKYDKVFVFNSGWFPVYYLFAAKNYDKSLIGRIPHEFQIEKIENINFVRFDCPEDLWQKNLRVGNGKTAIYLQKDCNLDKMTEKLKFVRKIKGIETRFENIALYEVEGTR